MSTVIIDLNATSGGDLGGDAPGVLDLTLTNAAGDRLDGRQLAIVNRADSSPATLFDALVDGVALPSNVVTTDDKGSVLCFCSGDLQVKDATTGEVLRDRVIVPPYIAPAQLPIPDSVAAALAGKASNAAVANVAGVPAPGLRTVIFGSSTDARCHVSLDATMVIAGGVATLTCAQPHNSFTGAMVSVGKSNPVGATAAFKTTAAMTRTGPNTLTVPAPGMADGSSATEVRLLQQLAPPSWWRALVQGMGGALELVANFAQGGETTTDKLAQYQLLDAFNPQLIVGTFGSGNDVLAGDTSATAANLQTMVRYHTSRGRWVLLTLPPCTPALNANQMTIGLPITEWAIAELRVNPRLLLLDEFGMTVMPMTGQGNPALFTSPSDVHAVHHYANRKGAAMAQLLDSLMGVQPDLRALSIMDRRIAHPSSRQICDGFWDLGNLGDAHDLNVKASGGVDLGITEINLLGSAGRSLVCSLVARGDGRGYSQRMVFSGAAGDQLRVAYAGGPGSTLVSRLVAGKTYDAGGALRLVQSAPATLNRFEHFIEATFGGATARLSAHVAVDPDLTEPPPLETLDDDPALFPAFTLPGGSATALRFVLQMDLAATGSVTIDWGLLTLRQRA